MMPLFNIKVKTSTGIEESPLFGIGDIARLKQLFPEIEGLKKVASHINLDPLDTEEAKTLYDALITYYAVNDVSDKVYQTGNFSGSVPIISNLLSVFERLINFFEKKIGFTSPEEIRSVITTKQQARKERMEKCYAEYLKKAREFFQKLDTLKPPANATIRLKLEQKLASYYKRYRHWHNMHPDLAWNDPNFRDSSLKILVVESVLHTKEEVVLLDLLESQIKKGYPFDFRELFSACGVISIYLNTPLTHPETGKQVSMD